MASTATIFIYDEVRGGDLVIPATAQSFDGFRGWAQADDFPERGRIDYLAGEIDVDMSPEEAYTHGVVKSAMAAKLHELIAESGLGNVFIDRMRIASPMAKLSAEPDVVVVLWSSLQAGRIREVPGAPPLAERVVEFEGAPDLVVEIVSDGSARKDKQRLPRLYAAAGIPELWLVDARGDGLEFSVRRLVLGAYQPTPPDVEGWFHSPLLDCRVRLSRRLTEFSRWAYRLEHAPAV